MSVSRKDLKIILPVKLTFVLNCRIYLWKPVTVTSIRRFLIRKWRWISYGVTTVRIWSVTGWRTILG